MPRTKRDVNGLRERDKVRAAQDLPGVPAGTPGRILVAYGLSWPRYRVVFENGAELGNLDRKYLEPAR